MSKIIEYGVFPAREGDRFYPLIFQHHRQVEMRERAEHS